MRQAHRSPRLPRSRSDASALEFLESRVLLSGDHPSLAQYPSATAIFIIENPDTQTAVGAMSGTIGELGDDDLFIFEAPYSARASISVRATSGLAPAIRLHNNQGIPMSTLADGWDGVAYVPPVPIDLVQGFTYYVNVQAGTPSDTNDWQRTGSYTVSIVIEIPENQQPPDDGSPVPLQIDDNTGRGSAIGFLRDVDDQDLYQFVTLDDGEVSLTVTTPGSNLNPAIEILDEFGSVVATGFGDSQSLSAAFYASALTQYRARITVDTSSGPGAQAGAYTLAVLAAVPGGADELPAESQLTEPEMTGALSIPVEFLSGFAAATDTITSGDDSDVFIVRALRSGSATVLVERASIEPFESVLDVFSNQFTRLAYDGVGGQAWIGRVTFDVVEGQEYFIRIRGRDDYIGAYTVKALLPLNEYIVMYPEGYSTGTIDEYVPLVNPNPFDVSYTITARYEVGERDQVIATGVVPASSRGGITITSQRNPGQSLVRTDTPYALEVRSSGQLGATLSHYDFGVTTGENFTNKRSTTWIFAEAHRDADRFRDFLVFYNPNPSATVLRITLVYDDGEVVTFDRTLDPFRRGGVNFTTDTAVTRNGAFSIRVDADQPMIAALSSYDYVDQRGFGLLGDADGGDSDGAIPIFSGTPGSAPTVAVYNPSGAPANIVFTATILNPNATDVIRQFTIGPGQRRTFAATELGLNVDALAALRYSSDVAISVTAAEYHTGDGDSTTAGSHAVVSSIIADAFVNPAGAGTTYRELLSVYNPWGTPTQVQVSLLREGGTLDTLSITVAAGGFSFIRVDQMPGVLAQGQPVAFSIRIDGAAPVVAGFMHYDLFLDGGWGTLATPLGITTALALI